MSEINATVRSIYYSILCPHKAQKAIFDQPPPANSDDEAAFQIWTSMDEIARAKDIERENVDMKDVVEDLVKLLKE